MKVPEKCYRNSNTGSQLSPMKQSIWYYGVLEPVSSQFRCLSVVFPKVVSSVPLWWEKVVQAAEASALT